MKRLFYTLMLAFPFVVTAQTSQVTFIVDMSDYTGSYTNVNLNGTFNNWCGTCATMTDPDGDSVYTLTIPVTPGAIEWKFTLDGWTNSEQFSSTDPCTVTSGGYTNRSATIGGDTVLQGFCYNQCSGCDSTEIYATFQVNMANETVDSNGVHVAGGTGMGGPTDHILEHIWGTTMYTRTFKKPVGFHSDYIFLNGACSDWSCKESMVGAPCVVGQWSDRTTDTMNVDWYIRTCFEECVSDGNCPAPAQTYNITFSADMTSPKAPASFSNIYISGTMNGWAGNANELTDPDGDSIYTITLPLDDGTLYEYKITADNWANQEQFDPATDDSTCTMTTGGFTNRIYTVAGADDSIHYCYNYCYNCDVVSTEDLSSTFMLMPNPARDQVTLSGLTGAQAQIQFMTVDGRVVLTDDVAATEATLQVGHLPRGMYIVQITVGDQSVWTRVSLN